MHSGGTRYAIWSPFTEIDSPMPTLLFCVPTLLEFTIAWVLIYAVPANISSLIFDISRDASLPFMIIAELSPATGFSLSAPPLPKPTYFALLFLLFLPSVTFEPVPFKVMSSATYVMPSSLTAAPFTFMLLVHSWHCESTESVLLLCTPAMFFFIVPVSFPAKSPTSISPSAII